MAVGDSGAVLTSPDGVTGTPRSSGIRNRLVDVKWSGTQWITVGQRGTILTSPDGVTWTPRASGTTKGVIGVAWSGNGFVAVGAVGTILTSPDGVQVDGGDVAYGQSPDGHCLVRDTVCRRGRRRHYHELRRRRGVDLRIVDVVTWRHRGPGGAQALERRRREGRRALLPGDVS